MLIKYINTKEDYCDVLEYFGIKKLKVLNFIAFCLSIVVAICIYVLLYKFDNIYRVIISLLISILICVFALCAKAQDMAAVFISMPDQYIPQLENAWRKDLVDLYKS